MLESAGTSQELTTAALREALPEIQGVLAGDLEYRWASEDTRRRVRGELEAMRQVEAMGYYHRVELHRRQALDLFRQDFAEQRERPAAGA